MEAGAGAPPVGEVLLRTLFILIKRVLQDGPPLGVCAPSRARWVPASTTALWLLPWRGERGNLGPLYFLFRAGGFSSLPLQGWVGVSGAKHGAPSAGRAPDGLTGGPEQPLCQRARCGWAGKEQFRGAGWGASRAAEPSVVIPSGYGAGGVGGKFRKRLGGFGISVTSEPWGEEPGRQRGASSQARGRRGPPQVPPGCLRILGMP